ncbi:RNA-binding protein 2-like isoform X2 [Phragmites australis]|uniref:RNA-binding protein 2-like isoform X2 n=1 Tax=Phragmites australis TaxID=29695 RepID=UPI002D787D5B|nr:RNA-binding protein 2-like isoform X2 [Phragmites australis]
MRDHRGEARPAMAAPFVYRSSSIDGNNPRGDYPGYLPPEVSSASYYTSRAPVLPGGPDIHRNDVPLHSRAYGLDGPAGVINPALPGLSGLAAGARARGPGPLEDPALAGLSGLAPARAQGSIPSEDPALVRRSSSLGKSAGIPDIERHGPLLNLDGPSEDESNILFVDGLPTDCTRREVAHLFRPFVGFKDIRVVHKEPRRSGDKAYVLCFVEFENAKCAFTAMEALQEYRFDDRKPDAPVLKIHFARFPFRLPAVQDDRKRPIVH